MSFLCFGSCLPVLPFVLGLMFALPLRAHLADVSHCGLSCFVLPGLLPLLYSPVLRQRGSVPARNKFTVYCTVYYYCTRTILHCTSTLCLVPSECLLYAYTVPKSAPPKCVCTHLLYLYPYVLLSCKLVLYTVRPKLSSGVPRGDLKCCGSYTHLFFVCTPLFPFVYRYVYICTVLV